MEVIRKEGRKEGIVLGMSVVFTCFLFVKTLWGFGLYYTLLREII